MPTAQLNTNGIGSLTSGDVTAEQLDAIRERIGPLEGLGSLITPFKIPQNFQDGGDVDEMNVALGPTVGGSFATGRSSGFLGGVADEIAARTAGGTRVPIGQASFYTEGTSGGRFLSAKDINYKEPGDVANFYGMHPSNIFAPGQFLNKFQTEAVKKGITTGGNAGILADLRSNKNVLGQQPAQAALLRQYLSTGTVPEGLDSQFAINAYDWAIREQGRQQQTKSKGFLGGSIGAIIGTIGGAIIGFVATGFNPAGAITGAKIGGTLGGAGQAINEKRGPLGIALGALGGYGVGSLGAGVIGSFSAPTLAAGAFPAFGGGVGHTLVTKGLPQALSQAGTAISSGIGSFGSSLASAIRHPIQALQSGIGSLATAFRSPLQTLKGAYGFNVAPAGTTAGLNLGSGSTLYSPAPFSGTTGAIAGPPGLVSPQALGLTNAPLFPSTAVPSSTIPGSVIPSTAAAASLNVPGSALIPNIATSGAPGLLARGIGTIADYAKAHPWLTAAGVYAGYNALTKTAAEPIAAEQIQVQPQTGLGTVPTRPPVSSGVPGTSPEMATLPDIRTASKYGFIAPPELSPMFAQGGGPVVDIGQAFPLKGFLPSDIAEKFMEYEGGSKSYSDSSGEGFEITYDRQAGTGREPQSRVRVIKNRNGIGGYFPRNAEGYFQSPLMA